MASEEKVSYRIICVSHLSGAEGDSVARSVSERLGFRYLDEEIIERAAEWVDLDPSVVGGVERRKSLMARIGEAMRGQTSPRLPQAPAQLSSGESVREMPSAEDLRALIRDVIRDAAEEGEIVIASHAASMVLAERHDALRVLVTASRETRAERIASARNIDLRTAGKVVDEEDSARADYLKRFHGLELELPTHYDLVVNTDKLAAERGAKVIVLAAE